MEDDYVPPTRAYRRSPSPVRRYAPYARPQPAAPARQERTNYHWYTLCAVRKNAMEAYDALYNVHRNARQGEPPTERQLSEVLSTMGDMLACGTCGVIIPRLDNSSFVAKCGHVYHKDPVNCWEQAGKMCCLSSCRRGGDAQ
jgi:hypothetical protein